MDKEKIIVEIDKNGNISMETFGMQGKTCAKELKALTKYVGKIQGVKKKPEYYIKIEDNKPLTPQY